jgi:hypothetical protein
MLSGTCALGPNQTLQISKDVQLLNLNLLRNRQLPKLQNVKQPTNLV